MSGVRIIYTLFGSEEAARAACGKLLEEGLIACANRLAPATSQFRWQGELREEREWPVILKTDDARAPGAANRLAELHDYDVPPILLLPVDTVFPAFEQWVAQQLRR